MSAADNDHNLGTEVHHLRQGFGKIPLPSGAKRALRLYRKAEVRRLLDEVHSGAREAARKLVATKEVKGKCAEALRLYAGMDNGKWRTYREVGQLMNISKERVRQLLQPSKLTLNSKLTGQVPWLRQIYSSRIEPERECLPNRSPARFVTT